VFASPFLSTEVEAPNPAADAIAATIRPRDLGAVWRGADISPNRNAGRTTTLGASFAFHAAICAVLVFFAHAGVADGDPLGEIPIEVIVEAARAPAVGADDPPPSPPEQTAELQEPPPSDPQPDAPRSENVVEPAPVIESPPVIERQKPAASEIAATEIAAQDESRQDEWRKKALAEAARRNEELRRRDEDRARAKARQEADARRRAAERAVTVTRRERTASLTRADAASAREGRRDLFDAASYRSLVARAVTSAVGRTCSAGAGRRVVVALTIGSSGGVVSASLSSSSGNSAFDSAAVAAVRRSGPFPPPAGRSSVSVPVAVACR
jgi:TonB family protein